MLNMLPIDIRWEIFRKLSVKDLARCAHASRGWRFFSTDPLLWKLRLMDEFHFSNESVERLKGRLARDYKEVYRYCVQYELNGFQIGAIHQLTSYNLTREHLCGRDWFDSAVHINALVSLVVKDKLDPILAITEMDHLNDSQAHTLSVLYSKGLRSRPFRDESYLFFLDHQLECLLYLTKHRECGGTFDVGTALTIMRQMSFQVAVDRPYESQHVFSNKGEIEDYVKGVKGVKYRLAL